MTRQTYARVKCIRDFRIALPKDDLTAKEGEIIVVDLKFAVLIEKYGLGKILWLTQRE